MRQHLRGPADTWMRGIDMDHSSDQCVTRWRLGRRPALDGIRAVAAVAVVLTHADVWGFKGGSLGVDVFFALSGFLITSLLVEELLEQGRVSLKSFWLRRTLRLIPAMLALVAVVVALMPLMPAGTSDGVLPTLLYYMNWHRAFAPGDAGGALGHTWSLAIEEQFYLLWPVVLVGLWRVDRSLRLALQFTLISAGGVALIREIATQTGTVSPYRMYNGFDFRADALLIGCALALAAQAGRIPRWLSDPRVVTGAIAGFVPMFATAMVVRPNWGIPLGVERTFAGAATAALIAAVLAGTMPKLSAVLSHPVIRWVGVRSYALYLWHYPIGLVVFSDGHTPTRVLVSVALSFAAATVSYRFVEEPFLRLKDRIDRRREDSVAVPLPLVA